ncbi:hypothetical protein [Streptomyces sp. NPDC097610]|uniref:hypothetical protein n=1 Tax=Streptomyces sp. NPDC097610 TaxID=3157227 RepID=UPI0033209136
MIVALAALVLIFGSAAVVLIRRDRRRAHAAQHVSDSGAVSAARDRDPGIGNLRPRTRTAYPPPSPRN